MPSFVIHIAVANRYLEKHKEDIKDRESFLEGIITPDLEKDKTISHYRNEDGESVISKYLETHKLENDFEKGYFLHLVTDKIFYEDIFKEETSKCTKENKKFYNDYDILNKHLIEKYDVNLPDKIKKYALKVDGKCEYLIEEKVDKFIDEVTNKKIKIYQEIYKI